MRKLTGAAIGSLDGMMQAPGGPTEDPTEDFGQAGWVFGIGENEIDPVRASCSSRHTRCF